MLENHILKQECFPKFYQKLRWKHQMLKETLFCSCEFLVFNASIFSPWVQEALWLRLWLLRPTGLRPLQVEHVTHVYPMSQFEFNGYKVVCVCMYVVQFMVSKWIIELYTFLMSVAFGLKLLAYTHFFKQLWVCFLKLMWCDTSSSCYIFPMISFVSWYKSKN